MSPVSKAIEIKELETLLQRAKNCAEDLVAEVSASNPGDNPVTVRRRERDTVEARWLLRAIPALALKYEIDIDK